jgi:integrase
MPNGERVRKNFKDQREAIACRMDLERSEHGWMSADVPRITHLSEEQLRAAEYAFSVLVTPDELGRAVEWWGREGKRNAKLPGDAVTIDVAWERFKVWVDAEDFRAPTKKAFLNRVGRFVKSHGNRDVAFVQPEDIEAWLDGLTTSPVTRDNDRVAVCRFFTWCIARPQRFIAHNPAKEVRVRKPMRGVPQIYSIDQIRRILNVARTANGGRWLRYIVLQLFCGLRPAEAQKIDPSQINLVDAEIRIEAHQSKKKKPRTVHIDPASIAWLKICNDAPVTNPFSCYYQWTALRDAAGIDAWIADGFRHTAISMKFRTNGSYGLTAEWAGNSERIIKAHYQGRVNSTDAASFWAMTPDAQNVIAPDFTPAPAHVAATSLA